MIRSTHQHAGIVLLFCALVFGRAIVAQDRYFPLDHRQPTGQAGRWAALTRPQAYGYMQPVQVRLPGEGLVAYFSGSSQNSILTTAPSQVSMMVGHTYRIQISGMPDYPGLELYPTIEILDRLHPPEDRIHEFPIPIDITREEIEYVMQDQMVTKVIYLEQPDFAAPVRSGTETLVENLPTQVNLLEAADYRGRPMAILRIGGRIPDPRAAVDEFYSTSPIMLSTETTTVGN